MNAQSVSVREVSSSRLLPGPSSLPICFLVRHARPCSLSRQTTEARSGGTQHEDQRGRTNTCRQAGKRKESHHEPFFSFLFPSMKNSKLPEERVTAYRYTQEKEE
mmetsp:Transcript_15609/g.31663  ORF Transcript_15609/g.31663 Transcript_15609/m.31663 type:complete len:105 (-) Transcript_15609:5523-5837(-)